MDMSTSITLIISEFIEMFNHDNSKIIHIDRYRIGKIFENQHLFGKNQHLQMHPILVTVV